MKNEVESIKSAIKQKPVLDEDWYKWNNEEDLLSSGSALIDLACSGSTAGAFIKGHYYFYVGDSSSGKTFLALTMLAEAANKPSFKDYELIYDNAEDGALMNMQRYFGERLARKLKPPMGTRKRPIFSETIEEFYFNLIERATEKPCIYILDSMDALSASDDVATFKKRKQQRDEGEDMAGTYGTAKAKANSTTLRLALAALRKHRSILLIICQTRDGMSRFEPKTRSGGRALRFYATCEIWTAIKKRLKKTVRGTAYQQGIVAGVRIKKNRITGNESEILVPVMRSIGIDEIASCVAFLKNAKHWKVRGGKIIAPELDYKGSIDGLIQTIDEEDLIPDLKAVTQKVWDSIQRELIVKRKPRYA